jgi:predicted phage terminase large subunit-like protein
VEIPDPKNFTSKQEIDQFIRQVRTLREGMQPRPWASKAMNKQLPPDDSRHHLPWTHPVTGITYRCSDYNPDCTGAKEDWIVWLYQAGRGVGKTLSGANWTIEMALSEPDIFVAVCAPTYAAIREVCFEGSTGILRQAQSGEVVSYNKNDLKIVMRNGSVIKGYSAEQIDSVRGANLTYAWLDELSSFPDEDFYTYGLRPALRIKRADGGPPRMMVTTTPKPVRLVRNLMKSVERDPELYHVTRATSWENPNLQEEALKEMEIALAGSNAGRRQELLGELVLESDNSFFQSSDFDKYRIMPEEAPREYRQIVIGVDPATTSGVKSDDTGIVVIGELNQQSYVLEDASLKGSPDQVMEAIQKVFYRYGADLVVVEKNAAGDYFTTLLAQKDAYIPVRNVSAMKGKNIRAQPVAHLNEIGRIHMVGTFQLMEEQLCAMTSIQDRMKQHDDRADAFVWAMHQLAGKAAADWQQVYGFGACKICGADVNYLTDKRCKSCGTEIVQDKQWDSAEKAAVRWWNAYARECPAKHKYPARYRSCPECGSTPAEYLAQVAALSGGNTGNLAYTGKNWFKGRKF